jgi:hypothetical protein
LHFHKFHVICRPIQQWEVIMLTYYGAVQLDPLVEALSDAHRAVDLALERRQQAIEALVETYRKIEEERAPLREAALSEAAE